MKRMRMRRIRSTVQVQPQLKTRLSPQDHHLQHWPEIVLHPKCMGPLVQRVVHLQWVALPQARKSLPLRPQAQENSSRKSKTCLCTVLPSPQGPRLCPRCIPIPPPPLLAALWLSRGRIEGHLPHLKLPPREVAGPPQQIPLTATLCLYLALGLKARRCKGRRVWPEIPR